MHQVTERPKSWTTFRGTTLEIGTIDHQHLSNIYWYHKLVHNIEHVWVLDEIRNRFNGQLMPYSPHIDFTPEIHQLEALHILHWHPTSHGEAITVGSLIYNGQTIGTIWKYNS